MIVLEKITKLLIFEMLRSLAQYGTVQFLYANVIVYR